jgi:glyoxylase-like metal-dependent hydrolase (beta-lactamase superfamily II)
MKAEIPLPPEAIADLPDPHDHTHEIAADLAYRRLGMVNVAFFGLPGCGDGRWVLIDAGIPGLGPLIEGAAAERFGEGARPSAIVLTHGHFDHIGCLEKLAEKWDVPIFAHEMELPYLNGSAAYPPPDPTVGGGILPAINSLFPRKPIDVSRWLHPLPPDGSVPGMPGWRWLHTPGHTPGHISLWRETDRCIIAGDAFITTDMASAYAVITQKPELHGPPTYFTPDWATSRRTVQALAALRPELAITGHGRAMRGEPLVSALQALAQDFDEVAIPKTGRYVSHPVSVTDGSAYFPPSG